MNEAETRAEHIDPALRDAGWGVVDGSRIRRAYRIAPGRIELGGRRGRLCPRIPQHETRRHRSEGLE